MMKDVDRLSRYIGILIHRHLVQIYHMRANDIVLRPSTYFYDTFDSCSKPCRVTVSDTTIVTKRSSFIPSLYIVHRSPINFTSKLMIQSYSTLSLKASMLYHIVPLEDILWLSFDSITTSSGSLLSRWTEGLLLILFSI